MCLFRWIFQAAAPLLKTPLSQAQQQAYSAAAATYTAVAGMRAAYGAAAAAQPVAGYAAVAGWVSKTHSPPLFLRCKHSIHHPINQINPDIFILRAFILLHESNPFPYMII